MDYARRQQPQHEGFVAYVNAVPGVMPALVSRNDIEPIRKKIDNLALAFVAPLGTDNDDDHISQNHPR